MVSLRVCCSVGGGVWPRAGKKPCGQMTKWSPRPSCWRCRSEFASSSAYWVWHPSAKRTAPSSDRVTLAVLPFDNLSGDPDQEYFSDGLTEEMIAQLRNLNP